jgi:hypothetical protein
LRGGGLGGGRRRCRCDGRFDGDRFAERDRDVDVSRLARDLDTRFPWSLAGGRRGDDVHATIDRHGGTPLGRRDEPIVERDAELGRGGERLRDDDRQARKAWLELGRARIGLLRTGGLAREGCSRFGRVIGRPRARQEPGRLVTLGEAELAADARRIESHHLLELRTCLGEAAFIHEAHRLLEERLGGW